MIPGSDTAKQDLVLLVTAGIALVTFFWLYGGFHPLGTADTSLSEQTSQQISSDFLAEMGFNSQVEPIISFRSNEVLVDSLQKKNSLHEFYRNPLHRELLPAFYWSNRFGMGLNEDSESFFPTSPQRKIMEIKLSEGGELLALHNNEEVLPGDSLKPVTIHPAVDSLITPFRNSSNEIETIDFEIAPGQILEEKVNIENNNGHVTLTNNHAISIARYYLERSGWPERYFKPTTIDVESWGGERMAVVTFSHHGDFTDTPTSLVFKIHPYGTLLDLTYTFKDSDHTENKLEVVATGMRILVTLVAVFWIVILFFIRFRLRLIDMKVAILMAVLAGIIVPMVTFLGLLYEYIGSFGELDLFVILTLLIPTGFIAALTTLAFFAVTAISDSITRKSWADKLQTIDMFRVGYVTNIPLGLNIIRGICYGFIILAFWVVVLIAVPGASISISTIIFESDTTYLPYVTQILTNIVVALLVVEITFLIFVGQLKSVFESRFWLIVVPAIIFGLMHPFPFDLGTFTSEFVSAIVVGLFAAWIYYKEDFLTVFITLIVFSTGVTSATGWLVSNSPDALIFYAFLLLTTVSFIFGGINILKGTSARELPNFVPEYIRELAQEDRIKQELQIARTVQQSFLPVKTPEVQGLDIAAICKPAYETGGDYYDFITLDDHSTAVAIGDVSGKGIQAAFFMTFTKGILHALCNDYRSTIEVLSKANKLFRLNAKRGTFISLIFGIIKPGGASFRFSRAGHNPLLYYESKTDTLKEFRPQGLAIGMAEEKIFKKYISEEEIELSKNDILVLFTDGVVESVSKTNKVYGDSRLFNLIKKNHHLSATDIIKKIDIDLQKFEDASDQHDDMTMIVIKKK